MTVPLTACSASEVAFHASGVQSAHVDCTNHSRDIRAAPVCRLSDGDAPRTANRYDRGGYSALAWNDGMARTRVLSEAASINRAYPPFRRIAIHFASPDPELAGSGEHLSDGEPAPYEEDCRVEHKQPRLGKRIWRTEYSRKAS